MNLREQLRNILPEILPDTPDDAIKGTELIRLVRLRLGDDYSDATLRYHFSILSYDSTSPIAKVDQGQGYYQRQKKHLLAGGGGRFLFGGGDVGEDIMQQRFQRLLVIYERLCLLRSQYPFQINGRSGFAIEVKGLWDIPDLVTAEWDLETGADEVTRFDSAMLDLRRHLGAPEVNLTGVQLKLGLALDNYAAEFFQALSATRWTLQSEMVVAEPLSDEALVDSLRSLGNQFGVGISSLGISGEALDDLPSVRELRSMNAAEFEAVQGQLRIQRITVSAPRHHIDWPALSSLRKKHEPVSDLVRWLSDCLNRRQPDWK
ncbi:MAG TPA: hypothetical protein VD994_01145 [Prosthecobacter sp.]|nr:hypothetical protein [Prosthecobacter sp.]